MVKISKDKTIAELVRENPDMADLLANKGLGCIGCPMAQFETIEMGALSHGIDPEKLIKELDTKNSQKPKKAK